MDFELNGKVALVTGGARGIGRACAVALAREGARVTIADIALGDPAEETITAIKEVGGEAHAVELNVSDADACKKMVTDLAKEHGGLHILVNNAGISVDGLILRYKDQDLERSFQTNVFGPFYLARAASRHMMKEKWGRIIMMGSVVGEMGNIGQTVYAATKAAVRGMAKSLAREFAVRNVTANVIAPGFIDTDMTRALPEEARSTLLGSIPMGRMGEPEEIADAVTFLSSNRARYITGQVLGINGGLYM